MSLGTSSPLPNCPSGGTCRFYSRAPAYAVIQLTGTYTSLALSFGPNPLEVSKYPSALNVEYQVITASTLRHTHSLTRATNLLAPRVLPSQISLSPMVTRINGERHSLQFYLPLNSSFKLLP
jgi:hypothetical protein